MLIFVLTSSEDSPLSANWRGSPGDTGASQTKYLGYLTFPLPQLTQFLLSIQVLKLGMIFLSICDQSNSKHLGLAPQQLSSPPALSMLCMCNYRDNSYHVYSTFIWNILPAVLLYIIVVLYIAMN